MRSFAVFGAALGMVLAAQPGLAGAQVALTAPDGQSLDAQSLRTRQAFEATYGATCAPREWVWQHTLAIDTSLLEGPPAADGQQLEDQDDDVQLMFVAVWGPTAAAAEWAAEHNAIVAHRVLAAPVGQITCPAARTARGLAIDTAHLEQALAAARQANLPDAHGSLNEFRDVWTTTRADIRRRSPAVADMVQAAYDQAAAVISDPGRATPGPSEYLPVLQTLLDVVQRANEEMAQ